MCSIGHCQTKALDSVELKPYNGLRLTLRNKKVKELNGVAFSAISNYENLNGTDISVFGSYNNNLNGLAICPIGISALKINGLGISGIALAADSLNGFFICGFGPTWWNTESIDKINGVTAGLIIGANAKEMNGLTLSIVQNHVGFHKGGMIGLLNFSENLNGIQIGLLNYAGNNKKLFRYMPFINFNFKKASS